MDTTDRIELSEMIFHAKVFDETTKDSVAPPMIVAECACHSVGCSVEEFFSKTRERHVVMARQIAMAYTYSSEQNPVYSLAKIGKMYGDRDHSTVLHAVTKISGFIHVKDKVVMSTIDRFLNRIKLMGYNYLPTLNNHRSVKVKLN